MCALDREVMWLLWLVGWLLVWRSTHCQDLSFLFAKGSIQLVANSQSLALSSKLPALGRKVLRGAMSCLTSSTPDFLPTQILNLQGVWWEL